jgi:hypothetical protein
MRSWVSDTSNRLTVGFPWSPIMQALPYFAEQHDTAMVRSVGDGVLARLSANPRSAVVAPGMRHIIAGFAALARNDTTAALKLFDTVPRMNCAICARAFMLTHAQLLSAHGRRRESQAVLRRRGATLPGLESALWSLERGRVAEALGEREAAITGYGRALDQMRHADPELQPIVREARAGLDRLGGDDARRRIKTQ